MALLFEGEFERTLDGIVARFTNAKERAVEVEVWSFDDVLSRRAAEAKLAQLGVNSRLRSAYKPLLHFFLEEVDINALAIIQIIYPRHAACSETRFRAEAYPIAALTGDVALSFMAGDVAELYYYVTLTAKDGTVTRHTVFAPNRVHVDLCGNTQLSPTGWIKLDGGNGERLQTDFEMLFDATVLAVTSQDWGKTEPLFEELNIAVSLPARDQELPVGEEVISLREALAEDLHFTIHEHFRRISGREPGDVTLQPGQIVPEVRYAQGAPSVRVETKPLTATETACEFVPLSEANAPVCAAQIRAVLDSIGGEVLDATSRSGRAVSARYVRGSDTPVIITAGQHANETTAIVGALRAAQRLSERPEAHFVIAPLENPDGYQLHWRLRADNPRYHHHAARFTGFGDDMGHRTRPPLFEREARNEAVRRSEAKLHLNLHGYSSHEWTRPLSGYVPYGFEAWTVPKGFFVIMRHHEEWAQAAEWLVDRVTARLNLVRNLVEFNSTQIDLFGKHLGETGLHMINGIPCSIYADHKSAVPLTFVTEYPDQTIYGSAFVAGHDAQTEFVLAAYEAYQQMPLELMPLSPDTRK
ncbi:peptidase M14 [Sinorhizobium fredii]|uniref:Peptidase M14 n=1 Tax=Rhizobium fredii TaxID=380 RepID=A0A2A6LN37_RHIFR|nr:peptidase M14 [Sinorhizobium fredii]PDT43755.1 peptidase M14 [Sinorhizobium fredii]